MELHPGKVTRPLLESMPAELDPIRRALQENEDWYRDLVEHSQDLLCIHDLQGRLLSINPSPARVLGYSVDELLRIPMREVIAPEFRTHFDLYLNQLEHDREANGHMVVLTRVGERRIWHYHSTLRTEGVAAPIVRGTAHDVTEQKRAAKELRESSDLNRQIVEGLREGVILLDKDLHYRAWNRFMEGLSGLPAQSVLGRHVLEVFPEAAEHGIYDCLLRSLQGEIVEVPDTRVLAHPEPQWISSRHSPVRNSEGQVTGVIVAVDDITKRKLAEADREASETRFRLLYEKSPIGICLVDTQTGRFLKANPKFCEIVGRSEHELMGLDVPAISHPDDVAIGAEKMRALALGEIQHFELEKRFVRPDGNFRLASISVVRTSDGRDRPSFNMASVQDITDRRQAEDALRESEARERARSKELETLFDAVPIPVLIARDADCRFISANRAGNKLLRLDPGGNASKSAPPHEQPAFRFLRDGVEVPAAELPMQKAIATAGPVLRSPLSLAFEDGEERDVFVNAAPLIGEDGKATGVVGAFIDVTERKRVERALRASEERFRSLVRASSQIVWTSPADGRQTEGGNPEWQEFTGQSPSETAGDGWASAIHPEDRERTLSAWRLAVASGSVLEVENRIRRYDGVYRHMLARAVPVQDASGKIIEWVGMHSDITEKKLAEVELRRAKEKLAEEKLYLEQAIDSELGFGEIIGQSKALKSVMEQVSQVATSDATVLLLGETGTGKELIARAIHRQSQRRNSSFIKMNCAAIPTGLLESELFGHEKGAFTGAVARKIGRLELADKGTLFLDEVGEIPLALQPKLLRVLQDQEFERLGGTQTLKVNFRLIAATNRDLAQSMKEKQFRSDLYYRLHVFPVQVPPLRERRDDIRLLVEHFVKRSAAQMNRTITSIPKRTMDALLDWDWPGNIRELENFIERSVILSRGSVLAAPIGELVAIARPGEDHTLEAAEREHIVRALRDSRGQLSGPHGAATRLGLARSTLQWKIKQLGIDHQRFRD